MRREIQNRYKADLRDVEGDEPDTKLLRDANVQNILLIIESYSRRSGEQLL